MDFDKFMDHVSKFKHKEINDLNFHGDSGFIILPQTLGHNNNNTAQTIHAFYNLVGNITKINNTEDTCVFQLDENESKGFLVTYSNQGFRPAGEPKEYFGTVVTFVQDKKDLFNAISQQASTSNFVFLRCTETETIEQLAQKDIDRVSFTNDDSFAFQFGKKLGKIVKTTMDSVVDNMKSFRKKSFYTSPIDNESKKQP